MKYVTKLVQALDLSLHSLAGIEEGTALTLNNTGVPAIGAADIGQDSSRNTLRSALSGSALEGVSASQALASELEENVAILDDDDTIFKEQALATVTMSAIATKLYFAKNDSSAQLSTILGFYVDKLFNIFQEVAHIQFTQYGVSDLSEQKKNLVNQLTSLVGTEDFLKDLDASIDSNSSSTLESESIDSNSSSTLEEVFALSLAVLKKAYEQQLAFDNRPPKVNGSRERFRRMQALKSPAKLNTHEQQVAFDNQPRKVNGSRERFRRMQALKSPTIL